MTFTKQELLEMIKDYSEQMGLEKPNESVLEEIESQYAYDPYNGTFIFKITNGFLIIPVAFPVDGDVELLVAKAYDLDIVEMESVLTRMKKGYEELLVLVSGE